jgi:uncharacterized GH25 family protein
MNSKIITLACLVLFTLNVKAHSLWIETAPKGHIEKAQIVKVYFGEYSKNKRENVEARFTEVEQFTGWAVSPSGKQIFLKFTPATNSYDASFIPEENGEYVILVENKVRDVADWRNTSGKLGIVKQNYYCRATVQVGEPSSVLKLKKGETDITIQKKSQEGKSIILKAIYQGKPLKNTTLTVRSTEAEEQKLVTDGEGEVVFNCPKTGLYIITALLTFNTPGTYKGVAYHVFREKSTFSLTVLE